MYSMTGYGRGAAAQEGRELTIELKSVNNRFLDIGMKLPRQLSFLEDGFRKLLSDGLSRGHVDVYVNGPRILSDFPYKKATNYLPLPEGTYQIDIYPAGDKVNNVISRKVEVKNGKYYTLAAYGKDNNNLKLLAFEDNPYTNKGESKIRAVHLSPDSPAVDIAVRNGDVAFRNLNPRKASDYLHVTPMDLDLDVRAAGSTETVKSLPRIRLQPDTAYTVFIIGLLDGQPPLEAIMLTP